MRIWFDTEFADTGKTIELTSDTPFTVWAKKHGATEVHQGWGMLVEQAAESFNIWRKVRPDTAPVLKQMKITA